MTAGAVEAVLDRSAMESYAQGHVHVGELLADITDTESGLPAMIIAVPAVALMEAHAVFAHDDHARELLRLLVSLPGVRVTDLEGDSADAASSYAALAKGDLARAHAIWVAHQNRAMIITREPDRIAGLVPPGVIHRIPDEDA